MRSVVIESSPEISLRHSDGSDDGEGLGTPIDEGGFEADGRLIFSYAHPLFWAPVMIVGDGG